MKSWLEADIVASLLFKSPNLVPVGAFLVTFVSLSHFSTFVDCLTAHN